MVDAEYKLTSFVLCNEASMKMYNSLPLLQYYRDSYTHFCGITAVKLPIPWYYQSFFPITAVIIAVFPR